MTPILNAEELTKEYGTEKVLNGISLAIYENTFTVILGPSGSGKSTLLNILSGITKPTAGTLRFENEIVTNFTNSQLADWKRIHVGTIFQNYLLLNNLTAEENIKVGLCPGVNPISFDKLTDILEIKDLLNKFPSQLSGGQQQRVAIARAVIKAPRLLFCDESTGSLDEENSKNVVTLLHTLQTTFGITILFTTHNEQIAHTANRVITMKNGLLYKDVINENPISANHMVWG